jgi:tetratricopeptide (TPR) repeat protein
MKPTDIAWPHWMRRYIATGSDEAYHDLIWSVGGSPPYGGVSWKEAEAVYKLLEEGYRGPGTASQDLYDGVRATIGQDREKALTLDAFRLHDRIASEPDTFGSADVDAGTQVANKLGDAGLAAYFSLLASEHAHRDGDAARAKQLTLATFVQLGPLAKTDPAYGAPLGKACINGASFAVLDGDFATARVLAPIAKAAGYAPQLQDFAPSLDEEPAHATRADAAAQRGGDHLESGDTVRALEWYALADRLATEAGDEKLLCSLLGDLAVAFRRVGNAVRAIEVNRRAVALCRKHHDDLNLARWSGNLGALLNARGDRAGARQAFTEAAAAARRTGRADQISIAAGHLATLLRDEGRAHEAEEQLALAQAQAQGDVRLGSMWRGNRLALQLDLARQARERHDMVAAAEAVEVGLEHVDEASEDDRRIAAHLLVERALIQEAQNDLMGAVEALGEAATRFDALGDAESAGKLRALALRYGI